MVEIAYGKRILKTIGEDLVSWNSELLHMINDAFFRFWLVDIFHFRTSLHTLSLARNLSFNVYTVRFIPSWFPGVEFRRVLVHSSVKIHLLTASIGKLANARHGCATKSDIRRLRKSRSFTCGTALFHTLLILTGLFLSEIWTAWAFSCDGSFGRVWADGRCERCRRGPLLR